MRLVSRAVLTLPAGVLVSQFAACSATAGSSPHDDDINGKTYDYIVVGGGVSGLVVANRLTEDSHSTVLVIERGDFDNKPQAIVPYWANALDTSVLMRVPSAPNAKLNNSTASSVAVAAVVGGGSVVNGMGYGRGSKADYDAWEELGNPGWGWQALLPYFRKSTTLTPPSASVATQWNMTWDPTVYGDGPLHVTIPNFQYPDMAAFWDTIRQEGDVPMPADAGNGPGAYWNPSTIDARDMTRATARSAYYDPVNATRQNLRLVTGQTATEILFGDGDNDTLSANGVKIVSRLDNSARKVYARKEVILAAGAMQTPQLLQVSGIGPASVLKAAGVAVKKDMPAVGANYQDHVATVMTFSLANPSFPNPDTITNNATYNETVWAEYYANKTGPIAAASASTLLALSLPQLTPNDASAIVNQLLSQDAEQYLPGIYRSTTTLLKGFEAQKAILAKMLNSTSASVVAHPCLGNGLAPAPLFKPLSRGTVTLNTSDPHGLPIVQFNTFMNPVDSEIVLAIVRDARAFWERLSERNNPPGPATEISPGAQCQTDEEILNGLITTGSLWPSLAHPSGTCAMMPEEYGGCVAPDLKVYGVDKLSVVDASIMPLIVGTALQATVYAVAEKAADLIKARRG
ncbi:putative GMC oxidoreductase [Diplogelasinospora grovesii]|uniref:GMC oxidoreductase n=1 Tax=Diplogelasinospora grovesii TaxID=303347 RepID=A0AAN6MXT3_9PEZI|nr:putative GMC oxidoreductase [Diplogelasinospora grovesii]